MKKTKKNTRNNSPIKQRLIQQLKFHHCCCRQKSRSNLKTISVAAKQKEPSKSKYRTKTKQKCKKQLNLASKITHKNLQLSRSSSSQQQVNQIKQKLIIDRSSSVCQCFHHQQGYISRKSELKKQQEITCHKNQYQNLKQPSQLNLLLENYQKILNQRIEVLKKKWTQVQILQKSLSECKQQKNKSRQPNQHVLSIQNEFYVAKITELQNQVKNKQQQIRNISMEIRNTTTHIPPEIYKQNKRLKQQNQLLERQNRVLKIKLKQAGFF